jgi:hypothetical protein
LDSVSAPSCGLCLVDIPSDVEHCFSASSTLRGGIPDATVQVDERGLARYAIKTIEDDP